MNFDKANNPTDPRAGGNAAVTAEPASRSKTPWHVWVVGFAASLFNAFGAWDYLMQQTRDPNYLRKMSEPVGITLERITAWLDAMPLYAHAAWGFAVWGTLLGSLLILARSGWSRWALTVGLAGMTVMSVYQQSNPIDPAMDLTTSLIFTVVLFVIIGALIWYAHAMWKRGVLR